MTDYLYYYRALVTGVYDGDTITVDIDLGCGIWLKKQKLRLYGIDTPELRGESREAGLVSRDKVREMILDKMVTLKTYKDKTGKYGRWLATIYTDEDVDLNKFLVTEGYAKEYLK